MFLEIFHRKTVKAKRKKMNRLKDTYFSSIRSSVLPARLSWCRGCCNYWWARLWTWRSWACRRRSAWCCPRAERLEHLAGFGKERGLVKCLGASWGSCCGPHEKNSENFSLRNRKESIKRMNETHHDWPARRTPSWRSAGCRRRPVSSSSV